MTPLAADEALPDTLEDPSLTKVVAELLGNLELGTEVIESPEEEQEGLSTLLIEDVNEGDQEEEEDQSEEQAEEDNKEEGTTKAKGTDARTSANHHSSHNSPNSKPIQDKMLDSSHNYSFS